MELLDRYLARIRYNLPAARADDIAAELRDELLDRIEAQEATLGRPLETAELSALLKDFGHPLVIAGRYRHHQYLIGPESYPFYLYGLRVIVVIALLVLLFAGIVPMLTGIADPAKAFLSGLRRAYEALIAGFAWFTLVFAVGERIGNQGARLSIWRPEALPPVIDQKSRNKWTSPIEVGFGLLFLLWLALRLPFPLIGLGSDVHVEGAAIWAQLYWPVLALGIALLAGNILNWLQPQRIRLGFALAVATTGGVLWAISYMRAHGPWLIASAAGHSAAEIANVTRGLNGAVLVILTVALIAWGIRAVTLLYQIYLRRYALGR